VLCVAQALQAQEVQTVARIKEHMETARRVLDKWLPLHGKQLYLGRVAERRLATLVVNYVPDPYHVHAVAERNVLAAVAAACGSRAVVARTLATLVYTHHMLPTARAAEKVVARGLAGFVGREAILRYRVKESTARWYSRGMALTLPAEMHVRALHVLRANVEVRQLFVHRACLCLPACLPAPVVSLDDASVCLHALDNFTHTRACRDHHTHSRTNRLFVSPLRSAGG